MANNGIRTPNEGKNEKSLKISAEPKYASGVPRNLELVVDLGSCSALKEFSSLGVHSSCGKCMPECSSRFENTDTERQMSNVREIAINRCVRAFHKTAKFFMKSNLNL